MAHVVAISNQKGGVAKTTTCISLGACLTERGHKTLLIDLDPQANLSLSLGHFDDAPGETITDALETTLNPRKVDWDNLVRPTSMPHLDVIPSDARLWSVERLISEKTGYEFGLSQLIGRWMDNYDYILFDCSPSLGPLIVMALTASNRVIIPIQTEFLAAVGLVRLIETVDAIREHTNANLEFNLLAVMYDQRNGICREVLNKLQENFSARLFSTVIGVDTRLKECVATGQPINQYDPKTRATQQYGMLAAELDQMVIGEQEGK
ncbi:ParA family protein [Leptolinea tardivitalis]|uniref:ParA family protein n=1 Tax=Leptolinea tardivitalis TaxID=229920 RepID=UPI00078476C9|nr:ParA family protein [Leptolinea tardivitalis]GAP22545.1 ATPase [Leptolinea tardivitalis]